MYKSLLYTFSFILLLNTSFLWAQWEPTGFDQSTWVLCQAGNGNLIATNDVYPDRGGIFVSTDEGETWNEAAADNHSYTAHLVMDESIYMGGLDAYMAISHDNGETWEGSNFTNLFPGSSPEEAVYAIEYHNNRIYASLFGHGVVYTEDQGVTWQLTDTASLTNPNDPENGGEWTYDLVSFNGKLYNIGAFGIWEYDENEDLWTIIDDTWYGNSSCVVDDVLYVVYNAVGIPAGIRYTTDFQTWEVMPLPSDVSTAVRTLEYHRNAFFMGHVNDAVFYSTDHGETWIDYKEDFPVFSPVPGIDFYGVPMNFVFSGETIFAGVFSPDEGVGGVFRAPMPEDLLGTEENQSVQQIVVFPNPATDVVSFKLSDPGQATLRITDIVGRTMVEKTIGNEVDNTVTIETGAWSHGTYLYSIVKGSSKASGKILVK